VSSVAAMVSAVCDDRDQRLPVVRSMKLVVYKNSPMFVFSIFVRVFLMILWEKSKIVLAFRMF